MKAIKNILVTTAVLFLFSIQLSIAQAPPPPNGGNGDPESSGSTPVGGGGGGAPIGGGLGVLLLMGLAYSAKKVFDFSKGKTLNKL